MSKGGWKMVAWSTYTAASTNEFMSSWDVTSQWSAGTNGFLELHIHQHPSNTTNTKQLTLAHGSPASTSSLYPSPIPTSTAPAARCTPPASRSPRRASTK
jgi:hypothetical protein